MPPYFVDTTPLVHWPTECSLYERIHDAVVGEEQAGGFPAATDPTDTRRCFNCGSPSHSVSSCPEPRNQEVISLSRQLFAFIQSTCPQNPSNHFERIHVIEEWRQQRLVFLDSFEPGQVRGALLRDAVGGNDGDWLKNMTVWGYPSGWVGDMDPRVKVRERIHTEGTMIHGFDEETFIIHGESGENEELCLRASGAAEDAPSSPETTDSRSSKSSSPSTHDPPTRWAIYPTTYFSSTLLPTYTGFALAPPSPATDPLGIDAYYSAKHSSASRPASGSYPRHAFTLQPPPTPTTDPPPLPPPPAPAPCPHPGLDAEADMDPSDFE
jgi:zinc finger CCHC domain-containing protein 8